MVAAKHKKLMTVKGVLNGKFFESEWFRRNRILLIMIFFLLFINITVKYKSEKVIREMTALEDSLIELRSRSISVAADVIRMSRQSVIIERVKKSGIELETSKEPPHKIYVDKE
ncbi:MAG: FtsL-like putative cell division protein [Mariniphaga sp.]